jgi:hypothetical protein
MKCTQNGNKILIPVENAMGGPLICCRATNYIVID